MNKYIKPTIEIFSWESTPLMEQSPNVNTSTGDGPGNGGPGDPGAGLAPRNPNLWDEEK